MVTPHLPLYEQRNILRVTRDRSKDEGEGGNTFFVEPKIVTPDALREGIKLRQTKVKISIADLMDLGRPPKEDVYKARESFVIWQVDAARALDELHDRESTSLERIPILVGFMTSQFRNIVQYHNPSDPALDGRSITQFLDRFDPSTGEDMDKRDFVMGGIRSIAFQPFNTVGKPPRDLRPGNEITLARFQYDFHGDLSKIQECLQEQGYSFQNPG